MSIATKTGDSGETSLMYGRRVSKADPRVEAYGSVDELNAALGVVRVMAGGDSFLQDQVHAVQKELIVVMGELATAPADLARYTADGFHLTTGEMVEGLTRAVEHLEQEKLVNFKGWAIPGDTPVGAALDVARTTCRRAERRVAFLSAGETPVNPEILRFLNRLSDLCWLLERYAAQRQNSPAGSQI